MSKKNSLTLDAFPIEKPQVTNGLIPSSKRVSKSKIISPRTKVITPYEIFLFCIERAENLLKIHKAAHGKRKKPEKYLADAHRAAIVLSISALDAFIRTFIIEKIRQLLLKKSEPLPQQLSEKIKKICDADSLLDAARKDDLIDRVEKAFANKFEKESFQGTKSIDDILKLVGINNVFHIIALDAKMNEDQIKENLDNYTNRRHTIAHRGDYELKQQPPKENAITKKYVEECIKLVKVVAECIKDLEKGK